MKMKKIAKLLGTIIMCLLMTWVGLRLAQAVTYTKPDYKKQHWDIILNATIDSVASDVTTLYNYYANLANLVNNWAIEDNILTMVTATPAYVSNMQFTLTGDYTTRFPAGAVIWAELSGSLVSTTVSSSSYSAPNTTVNLSTGVLTNPITHVYVVATRDGLWPNGPGYLVAADYGATQAALSSADGIAAAAGKTLLVGRNYNVTSDLILTSYVRVEKGGMFTISSTKLLTINGGFEAGHYRVFDCTGTGKVVFGVGAALEYYAEWFGAVGDGLTDDSVAWNNLISALPDGANVVALNKTYAVNNVEFNVDHMHFICLGTFKPVSNSGYVLRFGHARGVVTSAYSSGIIADGVRVESGSNFNTWTAVNAVEVLNLYHGKIDIRSAKGCAKGVYVYSDNPSASAGGCTDNIITLGEIWDNRYNVIVMSGVAGTSPNNGWCNDNLFLGGYLSWSTDALADTTCWNIYVDYTNDNHQIDNNRFIKPICEGTGNFIHLGGMCNIIEGVRMEDATNPWAVNKIEFANIPAGCTLKTSKCRIDTGYSDPLFNWGDYGKFIAATGALASSTTNTFTVTGQDLTANIWPGAMVALTMTGGVQYSSPVSTVSLAGGNTTITVAKDLFSPGSIEPTALYYWPIRNYNDYNTINAGLGNVLHIANLGMPGSRDSFFSERATLRHTGSIFATENRDSRLPAFHAIAPSNETLTGNKLFVGTGPDGLNKFYARNDGVLFAGGLASAMNTLSYGTGTIDINLSSGSYVYCNVGANTTLTVNAPTNGVRGLDVYFQLSKGTNALTITWNSVFKGATTTLSANKSAIWHFKYDGSNYAQVGTPVEW